MMSDSSSSTIDGQSDHARATAYFVGAFFDELIRAGVRDVVVSPGSRSTPLAMMAHASSCNLYLDVDERGAGFFALGLAKATNRGVCLICTSGTALANYYPAVMEAESSRVPLIVLSGDRPQRLQSVGAPQTCDQLKAFSDHVRRFWQMPEPSADPAHIAYVRQIAREACIHAAPGSLAAAPVHLNFPFDEPLKPDWGEGDPFAIGRVGADDLPVYPLTSSVLDAAAAHELSRYLDTHRVIALCGEGTFSPCADEAHRAQQASALFRWAEHYDIPLFADPLSQLRSWDHPAIIDNFDNAMARDDLPPIDAFVRFGRYPVSKRMTKYIEAVRPVQIVVDQQETRDFNATTDSFIRMAPDDFIASLLACSGEDPAASDRVVVSGDNVGDAGALADRFDEMCTDDYRRSWHRLNEEERLRIEAIDALPDDEGALFEGSYVRALFDLIPEDTLVFSANSMAIRAVDTFYTKRSKRVTVLANRGLNGIDGTVSSFCGATQAFDQGVLLTGDLTLLHDLNALALQNEMIIRESSGGKRTGRGGVIADRLRRVGGSARCDDRTGRPSLIIVLLNNAGGGIFDMLPQKSDEAYFERLFQTPHTVDFSAAASAFGVPYRLVDSRAAFEDAFTEFSGDPGIHLIETRMPLEGLCDRYRRFQ